MRGRRSGIGVVTVAVAVIGLLSSSGAPASAAGSPALVSPHVVVGPFAPVATPSLGNTENGFNGTSCAKRSFCVIVGSIGWNGDPHSAPIIEQSSGSVWSITTAPVPSGLSGASLTSVSCPSVTFCMAVGDGFNGPSGNDTTFAEQWNGTFWAVSPTPNYDVPGDNDFESISCTGPAFCAAVANNYGNGPDPPTPGTLRSGTDPGGS